MMVFDTGHSMFAVDCGQMLPDDDLLGIDMVIPDISYVVENRHRFEAVILTHGHEDHIGALPYLLREVDVPVYGTRLTCELVRERLREHDLNRSVDLRPVTPGETITVGEAQIEFIHVTHSIMESVALAIRLPFGTIIHTGDYKIDPTPIDGRPFDYHAFARYGEEGVLALFADSTNVEREGFTRSESAVIEPIARVFESAPRAIVFSCFASSLHRIQVVIDLARRFGRRLALAGLNMVRNVRIASDLGVLRLPAGLLVDLREARKLPREQLVVLTTGSQGEPLSALSRMALGEHPDYDLRPNDTVILSARMIPGNEKSIYRMMNHLSRRGARVVYERVAPVHASGHAQREEMRLMISLCRPKYLIPIHGEFRHLMEHRALGAAMGIDPENIFVLQDGDVLEIDADGAARGEPVPVSRILVDGRAVGDVDEVVLRDRKHLSEDGMVLVLLAIDHATAEVVAGPDIVSRGFLYMDEHQEFFEDCRQVVIRALDECERESKEEWAVVKTAVRRALKKFIKNETGRFPVILPVVLEI